MSYMKNEELRRNNIESSMKLKLDKLSGEMRSTNRVNDWKSKLEKVKKTKTLKTNIGRVLEFDKECEHNGHKLGTRYSTLITLHNLCQFAGKKPFKDFNKLDIVTFLDMAKNRRFQDTRRRAKTGNVEKQLSESSINHVKFQVKRFFRWIHGMDVHEYPECVRWMKLKSIDSYKEIDPEQLPTVDEIKNMIEVTDNPRYRALISLMAESGARVGEISLLQLKDIAWNNNGFILTIWEHKSKSKRTRRIPLCVCAEDLKNYINNYHPFSKDPEAALFISYPRYSNPKGNLKIASIEGIVAKVAKRSGVEKRVHIHPHIFRHARASQLDDLNWGEMMLRKYFGWTKSSKMPAKYIHKSQRNLNNRYFAMYGKIAPELGEPKMLEGPKACGSCGVTNPTGYRFCYQCNQALDKEVQEKRDVDKEIEAQMNVIATNPVLADQFKELLRQAHNISGEQNKNAIVPAR